MSQQGPEQLAEAAADKPSLEGTSVPGPPKRSFFAELPVLALIAFGLALLLKTFLVQAFFIPSKSMVPTLLVGDRVLVNKVVYELRDPKRGEIVVFHLRGGVESPPRDEGLLKQLLHSLSSGFGLAPPGERDFIKRVIGLPGDEVELRDGVVYVNGKALPEASTSKGGYLEERDRDDFGPAKVLPGHYFMMGDNRLDSDDSRGSLGQIPREDVIGRAFVIIWPFSSARTLPRPGYTATLGRWTALRSPPSYHL
ncbi:MAG: signal peptidase I [Egibacteraceae bacterium]